MILEGNITIPYKWTTGPVIGRFLGELRHNARLMGARCSECGRVYCPPTDVCGDCYARPSEWVALTGEGTVIGITVVERAMPWSPVAPPYTLALIKLDGADTSLLHLATDNVRIGDRVRAAFKRERTGSLLDIERFVLASVPSEMFEATQFTGESMSTNPLKPDLKSIPDVATVFRAMPSLFRKGKIDKQLSYYFSIDEDKWTVLVGPETCEVKAGKTVEDADCYLKTSAEIFLGTLRGDYTPSIMDFVQGKVKTNRPELLLDFKKIFTDD